MTTGAAETINEGSALSAGFTVRFSLLASIAWGLFQLLPETANEWLVNATGGLTTFAGNLIGIGSAFNSPIITVAGFDMLINMECTAAIQLLIFTSAVLAFPRHSIRYKAAGVGIGISILIIANVTRILALGVIGASYREHFEFAHAYLWQGLYLLLIFFTWYAWVNRPQWTGSLAGRIALAVAVMSGSIFVILQTLPFCLGVVAAITNTTLTAISSDAYFNVSADGSDIIFQHFSNSLSFPLSEDVLDSSILIALSALILIRKWSTQYFIKACMGLLALSAYYILMTMLIGFSILKGSSVPGFLMMSSRALSIFIPIVIWIAITPATTWRLSK